MNLCDRLACKRGFNVGGTAVRDNLVPSHIQQVITRNTLPKETFHSRPVKHHHTLLFS